MKKSVAVILFPGSNCEVEASSMLSYAGLEPTIVRWNMLKAIEDFDSYFLPGGWSYEDRIRAGVIASKEPMVAKIKNEAKKGKPVIGICNGAQILVEAGMVPTNSDEPTLALAPNRNRFISGLYSTWILVKVNTRCKSKLLQDFHPGEIVPMPIAHGEGRYTSNDPDMLKHLESKKVIAFQYCDPKGNTDIGFPYNPNGSIGSIAGISNEHGNVLAIMPHPERASLMRNLPSQRGSFQDSMRFAPSMKLFTGLRKVLEAKK